MQNTRAIAAPSLPLLAVLFTATIFLSALLLFFVQPLYTRMVLPQIGGAAAVWTTAMLFFQSVLILGYVYAHISTRHLSPRVQLVLHLGLLVLALVFLPLAVPQGWSYDPASPVVTQTLWLYALGVGLPFAVLSANAPLIQSWYGRTGAPGASDPYFLYAASNLGSFVALLGFPLVAEPLFGVSNISIGWSLGFVVLIPLLALAGLAAAKGGSVSAEDASGADAGDRVSAVTLGQWLFLAFLPSSLMLCVTTKISTDIGSFPLVWVVPLALYLLTFVLVFSARSPLTADRLRLAFPVAMATLVYFCTVRSDSLPAFAALIGAFFIASLLAHRLLFEARPGRHHLTLFYVTMSVGGALGGLFNSIIAPVAFDWLTEFPVTVGLFLLLFVRPGGLRRPAISAVITVALSCLSLAILAGWIPGTGGLDIDARLLLAIALLIGAAIALRRDGIAPAVLGISLLLPAFLIGNQSAILRDRSFFGVHVVSDGETLRTYANGTTVHGGQRLADYDGARPRPISYYHPDGSMAQVLTQRQEAGATSIGIVGLGIGALACYAQPGEDWHFYEIDQKVADIALDPSLFTYMTTCAPDPKIHLGDARIVLDQQADLGFDVLVIDAYSSDAIPVHLTTVEALQLYLARMNPDGLLVFHISNRFYDLSLPLASAARSLGLETRLRIRTKEDLTDVPYDTSSKVMILARTVADLGPFASDPDWIVPAETDFPVWTDDHANLLSALQ
jgi:hypothetical protein